MKMAAQESLIYRFNFFANFFGGFLSLMVFVYIWLAVYRNGGTAGDYSLKSLIAYYLIMFVIFLSYKGVGDIAWNLSDYIRLGSFSNFLVKPMDLTKYYVFRSIGLFMYDFFVLIAVVIALVIFGNLGFTFLNILLFILSLFLAAGIYFFISYTIGLLAFHFGMVMGINFLMSNVISFFSGSMLPLDLLSGSIRLWADFLPFKYIGFFPLNIIQGKLSLSEMLWGFGGGLLWLGVLFVLAKFIYNSGVKKYEAYGA